MCVFFTKYINLINLRTLNSIRFNVKKAINRIQVREMSFNFFYLLPKEVYFAMFLKRFRQEFRPYLFEKEFCLW